MHKNFVDLTPGYEQRKAEKLGKLMKRNLARKITMDVENKASKNFHDYVEHGGRLNEKDLKKLNPKWKKCYAQ